MAAPRALAEAVAVTKGNVSALTPKLAARQDRLSTIEARLKLLKSAPDVFSLEVQRIEAGVRKRSPKQRRGERGVRQRPGRSG